MSEHLVCWLVLVLRRLIDPDNSFGGRMSSDMVCERKDVWVISIPGEVSKGVRRFRWAMHTRLGEYCG